MKEQNEKKEEISQQSNSDSAQPEGFVYSDSEPRRHTEKEGSVRDDVDDFVFVTPKRKRKVRKKSSGHHNSSHHSSAHQSSTHYSLTEDFPEKSNRSASDSIHKTSFESTIRSRSRSAEKLAAISGTSTDKSETRTVTGSNKTETYEQTNLTPENELKTKNEAQTVSKKTTRPRKTEAELQVVREEARKKAEAAKIKMVEDMKDTPVVMSHRDSSKHHHHHNSSGHHHSHTDDILVKSNRSANDTVSRSSPYAGTETLVASNRSSSKSHNTPETKKKKERKLGRRKVIIIIVSIILAIVLILVGTGVGLYFKGKSDLYSHDGSIASPEGLNANVQDNGKYIVYNGERYKQNENVTSILFMGVDKNDLAVKNEYGTGGQADVIVLMAVDTAENKLTMMSIPRDTITDVSEYSAEGAYIGVKKEQLCLAYAYGDGKETSCENMIEAVRRIFYNMPINSYYALDLDGISTINDSIGGVDVVSPETVTDSFEATKSYHLMGDKAELFVRARNEEVADANLLRMERQKVYVASFIQKMLAETKNSITAPIDVFNASSKFSCTNLDVAKITYFAKEIVSGGSFDIEFKTIEGTNELVGEYAHYTLNEESLYQTFLDVFYNPM